MPYKNKDDKKVQNKSYYDANKEAISERQNRKITCECGSLISFHNRLKHYKSKVHLTNLSAAPPQWHQ